MTDVMTESETGAVADASPQGGAPTKPARLLFLRRRRGKRAFAPFRLRGLHTLDPIRPARRMKLSELLTADLVLSPLEAADKWQAIEALARAAAARGKWPPERFARVHDALKAREQSMTTGMEHGIAIPHAAVDGLPAVVAVLGLSRRGVPFEALDRHPARIIVCLIIPRDQKLLHIKTLAEIARLLSRPAVRARLLEVASPQEALDVIREEEGLPR
jgi:mannitol/fructose-specific phosphotransferase system IIA component (Ntr-type)